MKLKIHQDVERALADRIPVVALESTVITHGLPHPDNVRLALQLESTARDCGAVPATIAIIDGEVRVGLTHGEIELLASRDDVRKCSLRDIPIATAGRACGGTTVAATMHIAHAAGIEVFATGGIGGVHRGHPFDVSTDLHALGSIPVTVVCAGAKAILDIPLTLEVLETQGVSVVGYRTDDFPAFYSRRSGHGVDARCDSAAAIARIVRARDDANLCASILVVNPVPEREAMGEQEAEKAIQAALADADARGVSGKEVTPFLLARVSELTDARSKRANLSLLDNNVRLGAEIAAELAGE
jgi:pseudouridine-5'-phosphate glycosidase